MAKSKKKKPSRPSGGRTRAEQKKSGQSERESYVNRVFRQAVKAARRLAAEVETSMSPVNMDLDEVRIRRR